jgi:hypothetical protein
MGIIFVVRVTIIFTLKTISRNLVCGRASRIATPTGNTGEAVLIMHCRTSVWTAVCHAVTGHVTLHSDLSTLVLPVSLLRKKDTE